MIQVGAVVCISEDTHTDRGTAAAAARRTARGLIRLQSSDCCRFVGHRVWVSAVLVHCREYAACCCLFGQPNSLVHLHPPNHQRMCVLTCVVRMSPHPHVTSPHPPSPLQAFRARLLSGEDFATLASQESHCSSARRGGDLGQFGWVVLLLRRTGRVVGVGVVAEPADMQSSAAQWGGHSSLLGRLPQSSKGHLK